MQNCDLIQDTSRRSSERARWAASSGGVVSKLRGSRAVRYCPGVGRLPDRHRRLFFYHFRPTKKCDARRTRFAAVAC